MSLVRYCETWPEAYIVNGPQSSLNINGFVIYGNCIDKEWSSKTTDLIFIKLSLYIYIGIKNNKISKIRISELKTCLHAYFSILVSLTRLGCFTITRLVTHCSWSCHGPDLETQLLISLTRLGVCGHKSYKFGIYSCTQYIFVIVRNILMAHFLPSLPLQLDFYLCWICSFVKFLRF